MNIYWIPSATFVLDSPLRHDEDGTLIGHYARSLYVAARDESEASTVVEEAARRGGASMLDAGVIERSTPASVPDSIALDRVPTEPRVLWQSGRAFYRAS